MGVIKRGYIRKSRYLSFLVKVARARNVDIELFLFTGVEVRDGGTLQFPKLKKNRYKMSKIPIMTL